MKGCVLELDNLGEDIHLNICGSKSISQRALIINFLISDNQKIKNLSNCVDTITLHNILKNKQKKINIKEGGTTLRFLLCFLSLLKSTYLLEGDSSLINRPLKSLILNLEKLGVKFHFLKTPYHLPFELTGASLNFDELIVDTNKTSQFASALALISPYVSGGLKLNFKKKMVSKSFFDMTIHMMKECGARIFFEKNSVSILENKYTKPYLNIESDWASASYIYQLVAFSTSLNITLSNFAKNSIQGDASLVYFFNLLGVETIFHDNVIFVSKKEDFLLPYLLEWDILNSPDLSLSYMVVCLGLGINLKLKGINTLSYKESNRLLVMKNQLEKFDAKVFINDDSFYLDTSHSKLEKRTINTCSDHRVALAFAPLVLKTKEIVIDSFDVVSKSYPNFWDDLQKIGIKVHSDS